MCTCLCEQLMLYERSNVSYLFWCSLFRKIEGQIYTYASNIIFALAFVIDTFEKHCLSYHYAALVVLLTTILFALGQVRYIVYTCVCIMCMYVFVRCHRDRCYALILCLYIQYILTDCKKKKKQKKNYENVYCRACDTVVKENRSGCRKILIFNNAVYLYSCQNLSAI